MPRATFSHYRKLDSLRRKPAPHGETYDVWYSKLSGLAVRVSDTGRRTFILVRRFNGSRYPTRRAIGTYPAMTLDQAVKKAREWNEIADKGLDPATVEEAAKLATLRQRKNTFGAATEEWLSQRVRKQRSGREVERVFRKALLPLWQHRPIAEITSSDVEQVIHGIRDYGTAGMLKRRGITDGKADNDEAPAPGQARNLFAYVRAFFAWVIKKHHVFGLEISPCDRLDIRELFEPRMPRDRTLVDDELFALWRAIARIGYPYSPIYQLLLLTGLRLNEVADAKWQELDLGKAEWVIPKERMKATDERARAHLVPLTADMIAVLETVPRQAGEHVFSTTSGATPVWVNAKVKQRIDRRMLRTLRALARSRGQNPKTVSLRPWVNHDLRRTLRTELSKLRVRTEVAEAVLSHVRQGIVATYDRNDFALEKREALELWCQHLAQIVSKKRLNDQVIARNRQKPKNKF